MRRVRSGSSYLSSSMLAVTFGVGLQTVVKRVVVRWPNGRVDEFKQLATGVTYRCVEGQAPVALDHR
jgi:hypothetical protein